MSRMLNMMGHLNFFAGLSVIATTVVTIMFFKWYAKKKLPPADGFDKNNFVNKEIDICWFVGLFFTQLYAQVAVEKSLTFDEAIFETLISLAINVAIFFICYGILSAAGVNKENLYARCNKAFIGLVILLLALILLFDYAGKTQSPSTQNVPSTVNQNVNAEFVINLNGENIYIDRSTLIRIGDTHPDAAPEFQCVLIDDSDTRQFCEFKARGLIVMFIDGQRIGDSSSDPDIEILYNAIVKKFL